MQLNWSFASSDHYILNNCCSIVRAADQNKNNTEFTIRSSNTARSIRSFPYSCVASRKKWRDPIIIFQVIAWTIFFWIFDLDFWPMNFGKKVPGAVERLYELWNPSVAGWCSSQKAAAAAKTAHEGNDNTPSGPAEGAKTTIYSLD